MFSDFLTFLHTFTILNKNTLIEDPLTGGQNAIHAIQNLYYSLDSGYQFIAICLLLILALSGCFFGYRLSRFFLAVTGFAAGMMAGAFVFYNLLHLSGVVSIVLSLILGAILSSTSYKIYKAGVFLFGFVISFAIMASLLPLGRDLQFFLCTALGLVVGFLATKWIRPVIILTSAIVCGDIIPLLSTNISNYMHVYRFNGFLESPLAPLTFILLGIVVQFLTSQDPEAKNATADRAERAERRQAKKEKKLVKKEKSMAKRDAKLEKEAEQLERKAKKRRARLSRKEKTSQKRKQSFLAGTKDMGRSFLDSIDAGDSYEDDPTETYAAASYESDFYGIESYNDEEKDKQYGNASGTIRDAAFVTLD